MEIVELRSPAEHSKVLPVLRELYPSLDEGRYAALLAEIRQDNRVRPYLRLLRAANALLPPGGVLDALQRV